MKSSDLVKKMQVLVAEDERQRQQPAYQKTIAWLHYLGLLRHNKILPERHHVQLSEVLESAILEPRILELLPAIMIKIPEVFQFERNEIPKDLLNVMKHLEKGKNPPDFRGIPAQKYSQWLASNILDVAKRRLDPKQSPRRRSSPANRNRIAEVIIEGRMMLAMTQRQLADTYNVSLRIIRDLEQGKMDASLKSVNQILAIFGRSLKV